jgi:hypothetical protein
MKTVSPPFLSSILQWCTNGGWVLGPSARGPEKKKREQTKKKTKKKKEISSCKFEGKKVPEFDQ